MGNVTKLESKERIKMSFEVYLRNKNGDVVQVDTHAEGGTIKIDKSFTIGNNFYLVYKCIRYSVGG